MKTAIWWLRRDLRLSDNQALAAALAAADEVLPVFVIDPALQASAYVGERRLAFLWAGLAALDRHLRARGSRLVVRIGRPEAVLAGLLAEIGGEAIFAEEDYSPFARRRDRRVAAALPLRRVGGLTIHHPADVLTAAGAPFRVFTPFSRAWLALPLPHEREITPAPGHIPTPASIMGEALPAEPALSEPARFMAGEGEGQRRLSVFIDGEDAPIFAYAGRRDRLDVAGTAQLSPYLRFGMVSARQAVVSALAALDAAADDDGRAGARAWLNELIWREFYMAILYHFPHVRRGAFRPAYDNIPWRNDAQHFQAWCEGRTGYPVVDAAMRQLLHTGWMPNRARMIVASFLVKDLLIDWRWGERWFMQQLVDGDPAANNGGWQWTAGAGADAAPYFRIFNPTTQGQKHDPDGVYIRQWLPELRQAPTAYIHQPEKMPASLQQALGCTIGVDYPTPIVDHQSMRALTLAAWGERR